MNEEVKGGFGPVVRISDSPRRKKTGVPTNTAVAVGRFQAAGPSGYRAAFPNAPLRSTRAAAEADWGARANGEAR